MKLEEGYEMTNPHPFPGTLESALIAFGALTVQGFKRKNELYMQKLQYILPYTIDGMIMHEQSA